MIKLSLVFAKMRDRAEKRKHCGGGVGGRGKGARMGPGLGRALVVKLAAHFVSGKRNFEIAFLTILVLKSLFFSKIMVVGGG